ncbi:hypothetical protein ACLOJK_003983 [Asimina triloba]
MLTCGLGNSIFLASKLLNCYAGHGELTDSRWVFDKIVNRNLSLWNSVFVGYSRAGHFDEVLQLYSDLKLRQIGVGSSALTLVLKSCAELGDVEFGRTIHADAHKFGLNQDKFVGSSLVGLYGKSGSVHDAQKAFEETRERDVVAYTAMIMGYSQIAEQCGSEAFRIASEMQRENLHPNRVTLVSLLQVASQLEAIQEGKSIHCYAMRREIDLSDEIFGTSLVDMYIKCGASKIAATIFSQIAVRSVGLWNVMIGNLVQTGNSSEALELFSAMKQDNLAPDSITVTNLLLGCAELKLLHHGKSIHCQIIRQQINLDVVLITALIDMYSKCGRINQARLLFDRMKSRDVIMFNVIIYGFYENGLPGDAIEMFVQMIEAGIRPNPATLIGILSACSDLADMRKGSWIHSYIVKHELRTDVKVQNQILQMYAKCGHIENARKVFDRIQYKDLVSWTSMMLGYVNHGHADEALSLFQLMRKGSMEPDVVTLLSLFQAFSQLGCLKQVKEVHAYVLRFCLESDIAVINSLVLTYAKCGRLDLSAIMFQNKSGQGITSWNTMITAYGMHGHCREVLGLFYRMKEENVEPDAVTFTSVLSACSHAGLIDEAKQVFCSMTSNHFISPHPEHYACMVDLLGRAGLLAEAYDYAKHLPSRASGSALSSLLSACRLHRNTELAEVVGMQLLDVEPESSGAHALMSNIYAEAGRWSDVARIRAFAEKKGFRKIPGYSLVESDKQACGI